MLRVPASKASVPLTVVMRTRSRVPPNAIVPPPTVMMFVLLDKVWLLTHAFEPVYAIIIVPLTMFEPGLSFTINPAVLLVATPPLPSKSIDVET